MSDCGDEAAAPAGDGQCATTTVATTVTSELVAALSAAQTVTPAAAADSPAAGDDDGGVQTAHDDKHTADVVSGGVTSLPPARNKSQSSRKRCRPTDVSTATCRSLLLTFLDISILVMWSIQYLYLSLSYAPLRQTLYVSASATLLLDIHRRNLRGTRVTGTPLFGPRVPYTPLFRAKRWRICCHCCQQSDLKRLNYNKTVFGRVSAPDPAGRAYDVLPDPELDEEGYFLPILLAMYAYICGGSVKEQLFCNIRYTQVWAL